MAASASAMQAGANKRENSARLAELSDFILISPAGLSGVATAMLAWIGMARIMISYTC